MRSIKTDRDRGIFTVDEKPFLYVADTAWMAFSNMSLDEWAQYIELRRRQGFNVLQISILPILNDTSLGSASRMPYAVDADGQMDFTQRNEAYFDLAAEMVAMAARKGLTPALVALWNTYVPTAWAAEKTDNRALMPEEHLPDYAAYITRRFAPYNPIYLVSGDTQFETPVIERYYHTLLREIKKHSPHTPACMHLTPDGDVPPAIASDPLLDFYMFQSGHWAEHAANAYTLAEKFRAYERPLPVVNGEPCYEGHGHGGRYNRFSAFEVRKASWQSILAGAKAGITYGAHGVWMFHHEDMQFTSESFSGWPFLWQDALQFPGAWDIGHLKTLYEAHAMHTLTPRQDLLAAASDEVRAAASPGEDLIVVYLPYATPLTIQRDISGYDAHLYLLEPRRRTNPTLQYHKSTTTLPVGPYNCDTLLVAQRKGTGETT